MIDLITATQCLKRLKNDGIQYSKSYFSQMVADGKIRYHHKPPSPKKFFKYEEVKQDINDSKDPTRDAQREANAKARVDDNDLFNQEIKYKTLGTMSSDELEEYRRTLQEAEDAKQAALAAGVPDENEQDNEHPGSSIAANKADKEYWLGQKAKLEVEKMRRELIPISDAKAAVEFIFAPVNTRLDEIPHKMRAYFNDMTEEQYSWLIDHINGIKKDIDFSAMGEI
ncbi:hypothetical protein ACM66T_10170 [Sulfurimonas sp. ST-25]|uniref:hypothetical protein n=1 Tax=Sulfurimonas sp. ST-25 TaxID=3400151 RepID=UPI003A8615D3